MNVNGHEHKSVHSTTIDGFESFPSRIVGERDERIALGGQRLRFHQPFFDDYLRGILSHDLVLLGAPSGIGKTDLALSIASSNALLGKRVHYFALEAEPRELERRVKYAMLAARIWGGPNPHPQRTRMNYTDWLIGDLEDICEPYNARVDQAILEQFATLKTYYRGAHFDANDLGKWVVGVHKQTDLIVVDHLHYVDADDESKSETRALGDTVKAIRDVSLRIGKPILLVAHLRKSDRKVHQVIAELEDFHGSSNVSKIATQALLIEQATEIESPKWYLAPTFQAIRKDRRGGRLPLVALTYFDRRNKQYTKSYTLGRVNRGKWEPIAMPDKPEWAVNHRALEGVVAPRQEDTPS